MSKHLLYRKDLLNRTLTRSLLFVLVQLIAYLIVLIQAISPAEAAGPLSVRPTNPRYFFDAKGKSVYLTGSYLNEYNTLSGSWDFASYLDFLQQQKQNFTRVWSWEQSPWIYDKTGQITFSTQPYERTGPGLASDGALKFDLTRFNQAYFDQLRSRVAEAGRRGIYVSVMLFEGFSTQKKMGRVNPWLGDPFQQVNNINGINGDPNRNGSGEEFFSLAFPSLLTLQETFVRKVVDTLNDLDNVLYEVSGNGLAGSLSWQYSMIDYIKRYQAKKANQHPVGISDFDAGAMAEVFNSSADWIAIQETNLNPPLATSNKVLIMEGSPVSGVQVLPTSPISLLQLLPDTVVSTQSPSISNTVPSSNGVTALSTSATSSTLNTTQSSSENQQSKVATPTITPNGGVYLGTVPVTLQATTPGASIYYTTDGKSPTQSSSRLYTGKFTLSGSTLVKAKAFKSNFEPSSEASAWFANAGAVSEPGLVAYWKFDEGSGTTASDASGNGNTGTLINGPQWTAGKVGNALYFDGIDDVVTVADSNSLDVSSAFTLSAWVNPASTSTNWNVILRNDKYYLFSNVTGSACTEGSPLGGFSTTQMNWVCPSSPVPTNTWSHLALTYNGSVLTLYQNGVGVASSNVSGTLSSGTETLQIGGSKYGEYFKGLIDDVRIYNRALSVTEIQANYQKEAAETSQVVATPVISPSGGTYNGSVSLAMQTATSGSSIYYTTNGSTPTQSSTLYTGTMSLTSSATVKAKAFKSGSNPSAEASASFTVSQPFNFSLANSGDKSVVAGSSVTNSISTTLASGSAQPVSFSTSGLPTGATASFSTASCSPACSSTVTINTTGSTPAGGSIITVTATGGGITKTTTFSLTVSSPTVAAPTVSPNGGSYTGAISVTMQTATSGASIYYTTNGSTPTQSSTLYSGAMTLTSSATVKAKAFKSGSNPSAEASASFTVSQPFNFSLANSGDKSVVAGSSVTNSISTTLASGSAQPVSFSTSGLPTGATASFSTASCSPACSSTVTINTTGSTPAGGSIITVTATGGGITKTTTFSLTVSSPTVAAPTVSPNGGSYTGAISVTMQTATSGASIYYTTNGSTPTQSSTLYTGAMSLTSSATVKARAFKSGYTASVEASASFTVNPGLVAHWKFDEGSGTTASDASGNGNTGTLINSPQWTAGKVGNALYFDGIDDVVTVADSNSLDVSSAFTLSAWVNPASTSTNWNVILRNDKYYLFSNVTGSACTEGSPLGGFSTTQMNWVCPSSPVPTNTWSHLALTYNGSVLTLYQNGVGVASSNVSGTLSSGTETLQIGGSKYGEYFKGLIDEVRIYSRALSVTEIQALYQQQSVETSQTVASPIISPNGGNYTGLVSVTMQTATSGASIYYTTNGSTPTQSSTLYTGTMSLTSSATVKAKAFKSGSNASAEASASFIVSQPFNFSLANSGDKSAIAGSAVTNSIVATLVSGSGQAVSFSVAGLPAGATGSFSSTSCTLSCSTVFNMSTTGSTPAGNFLITVTSTGGGVTKTTAFTLSVTLALTVATPTITPNGGNFSGSVSVAMQTATPGASIYYTTNGSTPTQSSTLYTGTMTLASSATVNAKAFKSGSNASGEASASFTVSQLQLAGTAKGVTRYADGQLSSNCTSGNYSIAKRNCTGSDGNAYGGVLGLQNASAASAAGDTILVRSFGASGLGVYTGSGESGSVIPKNGTNVSNRSVIEGYLTERPLIQGIGPLNESSPVRYVIFRNVIIDGATAPNMSNTVTGVEFSRFENSTIRNSGGHGALFVSNTEFINVISHHHGYRAHLSTPGCLGFECWCGLNDHTCHGIYFTTNVTIDGGEWSDATGYGIHCNPTCSGVTIKNVRVHHNGSTGIILGGPGPNLVSNVVVDNNVALGLWIASSSVVNNITAYNNGSTGICINGVGGGVISNSIALQNGTNQIDTGANCGNGIPSISPTLSNNITTGSAASIFVDAANGNFQLQSTSAVSGVGANLY